MVATRPEIWWDDEQYAAWEASVYVGPEPPSHAKPGDYWLDTSTDDTYVSTKEQDEALERLKVATVDPDRAEAMRRARDEEAARLRARQRRLLEQYNPKYDPLYGGRSKCCWCGMEDRLEFFQSTVYYHGNLEDDTVYFECKDDIECAGRIARSAGRHQ